MKRGRRHIVAIDLETGGLEPGRNSILAIGLYWRPVNAGADHPYHAPLRVLVENELFTQVEPEAAAKCGWQSDEQWRALGALPLPTALDMLVLWLSELGRKLGEATFEPLGHNCAGVDRPFLEYWLERYDLKERVFGADGLLSHAWHDSMYALRAAQAAGLVPPGSASLDGLTRVLEWPARQGVHDALLDARGAFEGYYYLTLLMGGSLADWRAPAAAYVPVEQEATC